MLSSSAIAFGYDLNAAALGNPGLPTGIPGGTQLLRLVDAVASGDVVGLQSAQMAIVDDLNPESLVDAAGVFGNFEMMNRVAEGSGIPIAPQVVERMSATVDALGIGDFLKS
jgi:hypothetical protein